jgi:mitochondrial import inner membrane translocase subunit TIM8|uniref:Mitochondrial import inner membrane translocase subunit n=1 Tax=Zea mays TaxID=4577 RepID=A0A804NP94_MAIZE
MLQPNLHLRFDLFEPACAWHGRYHLCVKGKKNLTSISATLQQEQQKAMMNEMVGKLTSVCWDKCITSAPGSKFSSGESTCLTNCAQRFLDMSVMIAKRFEMK